MFFEFSRENSLRTIDSHQAIDLDERFENALRNTAMVWRQAVDRRLRRLGTSRAGWMTIAAVMQVRSPLSQATLADTLAVSRASMVHTIDRLVKDGLVKREPSASDRRLKRIVITDAGAHLYSLLKDEVAAVRRQMLAIVELDELAHLTEFLEQLRFHCHHRLLADRRRAGLSLLGRHRLGARCPRGILPAAAEREDEIHARGELQGIEGECLQLILQQRGL
jgi:MarR family transcriptional regulator, transcriptional regulator for hemolysin